MKTDQKPLNSGFGAETTVEEITSGVELRRKVCVLTEGHSGIGLETTRVLTKTGALVCVGAHDMTKARHNLANMSNMKVLQLDVADSRVGGPIRREGNKLAQRDSCADQ